MCSTDLKKESGLGIGSGIGQALFPKTRRKVLALFLLNPEKRFYFREAVRILGDTPGSLLRELRSLTKAGILSMEPIGIQKFYQANRECPVFEELRRIAEKTFGLVDLFRDLFRSRKDDRIDFAFLFGSTATGQDSSESDVDLMVIGTISFRVLVSILKPIQEHTKRAVNPTLYSSEEFRSKFQDKNNFVLNVIDSEKVFVVGDEDDLAKLVK